MLSVDEAAVQLRRYCAPFSERWLPPSAAPSSRHNLQPSHAGRHAVVQSVACLTCAAGPGRPRLPRREGAPAGAPFRLTHHVLQQLPRPAWRWACGYCWRSTAEAWALSPPPRRPHCPAGAATAGGSWPASCCRRGAPSGGGGLVQWWGSGRTAGPAGGQGAPGTQAWARPGPAVGFSGGAGQVGVLLVRGGAVHVVCGEWGWRERQ